MGAIETITSCQKRVEVNGVPFHVDVWNGTVANLTLMALGSSAPEILLAVIEIIGTKFHAGDLGPSTIVGSAAFNLFMIIGVCQVRAPSPAPQPPRPCTATTSSGSSDDSRLT